MLLSLVCLAYDKCAFLLLSISLLVFVLVGLALLRRVPNLLVVGVLESSSCAMVMGLDCNETVNVEFNSSLVCTDLALVRLSSGGKAMIPVIRCVEFDVSRKSNEPIVFLQHQQQATTSSSSHHQHHSTTSSSIAHSCIQSLSTARTTHTTGYDHGELEADRTRVAVGQRSHRCDLDNPHSTTTNPQPRSRYSM